MHRRILIIDGNNLAHQLFSLRKNSRVALAEAQNLTDLLCAYLLANPAQRIHMLLYFDGGLAPVKTGRCSLQIIPAHDADDEIIQRVFEGVRDRDQVVVVSGDEELCSGVADLGAVTVSAFEFILVHNPKSPRFVYPGSLPFDYQRNAPEPEPEPAFSVEDFNSQPEVPENEIPAAEPPAELPQDEWLPEEFTPNAEMVPSEPPAEPTAPDQPPTKPVTSPSPTAWYRTDPAKWPAGEGARFLTGAFCARHRADASALLHGDQPLRPADLSALASLLVATCGAEPNFCTTGSLMDRARLALLKAKGQWVSIDALAAEIEIAPVGLHGKIKKKAEKWVEFSKDAPPGGEASR